MLVFSITEANHIVTLTYRIVIKFNTIKTLFKHQIRRKNEKKTIPLRVSKRAALWLGLHIG